MAAMNFRRFISLSLGALALASLLAACVADQETKQGAYGEFCNNRDTDCRPEFICVNSVCVFQNPLAQSACDRACEGLEACDAREPNCVADCAETVRDWGDGVIEDFADCIENDLSCDEISGNPDRAAQICYDQLPLDQRRVAVCAELIEYARTCTSDATRPVEQECIYTARTGSDEVFDLVEECLQPLEARQCVDTLDCLNTVFNLDPALTSNGSGGDGGGDGVAPVDGRSGGVDAGGTPG